MLLPFSLRSVFSPGSSPLENAIVLKAALEFLVGVNMVCLKTYRNMPSLYTSGVRYRETPEWRDIPACVEARTADCKSLCAWRIAEERNKGRVAIPEFRFFPRPGGYADYHILVNLAGGREDPSRRLGMPSDLDF